jgi:phosphatidylglycerophosphate synthase
LDTARNTAVDPISPGLLGWSQWNALAALGGAGLCVAVESVLPAVLLALGSMARALVQHGPAQPGMANRLTFGRLTLFAGTLAIASQSGTGFGALVAAAAVCAWALDGADGWLARRRGETSAFGAQFDMETDAHVVLLLSLYLVVARGFDAWVLVLGALRYLLVLVRWLVRPRAVRERRSVWGRRIYALVMLGLATSCVPAWRMVASPLLAAVAVTLIGSFIPDFLALKPAADLDQPAA